jgi:hypothetical protein
MEGIPYRLDTIHGAADFDNPGGAVQAAAKLAVKLHLAGKLPDDSAAPALHIHDDAGQGHFALWLAHYLAGDAHNRAFRWLLSGRNVLALASARAALTAEQANLAVAQATLAEAADVLWRGEALSTIPLADISLDRERLVAAAPFALTAFFPQTLNADAWQGLAALSASDGIVITSAPSTEAERFDRKKPAGWLRLGDIKRQGFRALAYQAMPPIKRMVLR